MPSMSKKQHNLMAMVAHDPAAAKRLGISQKVGKEFVKADKGRTFKEGGEMKESKAMAKKEISFMKKAGAPKSMIKHEKAEYGMKKGGIATSLKAHAAAPASKAHAGMKAGGVAKTVTKEMEYDYKTGKKSFAGSTAKRDAHAEKEGKIVAKHLAYDKAKGYAKGGSIKAGPMGGVRTAAPSRDGVATKGKTKGTMITMKRGGKCI